jgi:hypothetical protein
MRGTLASDRLGHVGAPVRLVRTNDPFGSAANSAPIEIIMTVTMTTFDLTTFDPEFAWLRLPLRIPLLWRVWRAAARPIP